MRQEEILVAPFLEARVAVRRRSASQAAFERGVEVAAPRPRRDRSASGRRRRRTTPCVVTMWRVFMCTAGTSGERICATSEMPLAQKRGSSAAPGISLAELGRELAEHGRDVDADLLEHAAAHHRHRAAAAARRAARPCARSGRAAARRRRAPAYSSSIASNAAQMRSRSASNQAAARCWRSEAAPARGCSLSSGRCLRCAARLATVVARRTSAIMRAGPFVVAEDQCV